MLKDTIAAISTAPGVGAISIIRLSGDQAIDVANRIFSKDLSEVKGYTIHFGTIHEDGNAVDEVLLNVFRNPKSYTGEDMVEIMCHGGVFVTKKVLSLCLGNGARLARRGEFTQRAYLNGRIDLAQAEGVNDLIHATDSINASSAVHSLKGSVTKLLEPLTENLVQIIAQIEVNIDYPEYDDIHQLTEEEILPKANAWVEDIDKVIQTAQEAVFIRSGIDTVILGKPNVGKSSLLNALLEEDKAIVTDIAGTTRDLVEGSVKLGSVTLNLVDTAGIREASDVIEQIGIEKSMKALEKAELVIVVIDAERGISQEDQDLLDLTKDRTRIVVYNKNDKKVIEDGISISAMNKDIQPLIDAIEETFEREIISSKEDTLNNERQIGLAISAKNHMQEVVRTLEDGMPLDLATMDLQCAWNDLKEITGEVSKEDLLDEIFNRFCLGK